MTRFVPATATVATSVDPRDPPRRRTSLDDYSIGLATHPGVPCVLCQSPTGLGPIGRLEGDPICDRCLQTANRDLGAVLALISTIRNHARWIRPGPEMQSTPREPLSSFLEEFVRFAERWGPARPEEMWMLVDDETPS